MTKDYSKKVSESICEDIEIKKALLKTQLNDIIRLAGAMISTIKKGNKILIFGNGGSASDSLHITAELVGRFQKERRALPAIALTSNISSITAIGNDYSFDNVFERQIEALGKNGDMAIGISTSGNSKNVILGILKASRLGLKTAAFTGKKGGRLARIADIAIKVPSHNTPRIQESHITIAHIICEIIEDALF